MLKRIYVDNFRCLVNFELSVGSINLFLGPNGSGKSTVFNVLQKLQLFLNGDKVSPIFRGDDLTRWQTLPVQRFELEVDDNGGTYKYELAIEHNIARQLARVDYERLWFNNKPLSKFERGDAQLYRDNHSEGPAYPFDWSQSLVASLPERDDNTHLTQFKNSIRRLIVVQINPMMMDGESSQRERQLTDKMGNFVSWYRHISQDQGIAIEITEALREILDRFAYFKFTEVGEQQRALRSYFSTEENARNFIEYRFNELSDGQRTLIALHVLVHYARSENATLCIDEPENFLALPEIQPWLIFLYDLCNSGDIQSLLISHHPELIDYLASSAGYWFDRQNNSPVRVRRITENDKNGIPISELVARGWLHA